MAQEKEGKDITARTVGDSLGSSYWDRTDRIQSMGQTPLCCGKPMVAEDDHGRFSCSTCGGRSSF